MRLINSIGFKITLFFATLLFVFFQNCSSGFQVLTPTATNLGSGGPPVTGNNVAQCNDLGGAPPKLSQTCFGKLMPPLIAGQVTYTNYFEYQPQYQAYSDGATKRRWIYIPQGMKINTQDPDNWVFPKGTVIFKEFSVGGVKIETRQIEKITTANGPNAWRFSNFAWTTDQSDADLVTNSFYANTVDLPKYSANSVQSQFKISLPTGCVACHAGATDVVNGFNYLQLSSNAIAFNVNQAGAAGLFTNPPTVFDSIQGTALDQQAIGYIQTNCAICHGPNGPGTGNFRHTSLSTSISNENVILTGASLGLIVHGSPSTSILYMKFSSGQMPKVMPITQDAAGVALMSQWISALK